MTYYKPFLTQPKTFKELYYIEKNEMGKKQREEERGRQILNKQMDDMKKVMCWDEVCVMI